MYNLLNAHHNTVRGLRKQKETRHNEPRETISNRKGPTKLQVIGLQNSNIFKIQK
jgi:hypothetical protein